MQTNVFFTDQVDYLTNHKRIGNVITESLITRIHTYLNPNYHPLENSYMLSMNFHKKTNVELEIKQENEWKPKDEPLSLSFLKFKFKLEQKVIIKNRFYVTHIMSLFWPMVSMPDSDAFVKIKSIDCLTYRRNQDSVHKQIHKDYLYLFKFLTVWCIFLSQLFGTEQRLLAKTIAAASPLFASCSKKQNHIHFCSSVFRC